MQVCENGTNEIKENIPHGFDRTQFEQNNKMNLSQLSDDTRKEIIELEMKLESTTLTRGYRRQLQNKRNKMKARIKVNQ